MQTPSVISSSSSEIADLISKLPKQKWLDKFNVYQWQGYWYAAAALEGVFTTQTHFKARDDNIILASLPKSGTTWLKSLVSTIMNYCDQDPLKENNPHSVVKTLEIQIFVEGKTPDLSSVVSSPRIFHTHVPYNALPDSIKNSKCKLVYIARDPKDVFVSFWHFFDVARMPEQDPYPIEEAFESFCQGFHFFSPSFEHVVEYWKESLIAPEKIHFVKYEELSRNPKEEVKKLALFLGKPLLTEEQVDDVVKRCSFDRLKNLEINKNGCMPDGGMPHSSFFRRGAVGDWKNSFTPEMEARLNQIIRSKYEASGLTP